MKRVLIFRLSSLGDVILATAALGAKDAQIDWVVAREYASLLEGHPTLARVHGFDRRSGFRAWLQFCRVLAREPYDEIWDLHDSLRTRVARMLVSGLGKKWRVLQKPRGRRLGFFIFKERWPHALRPSRIASAIQAFAQSGTPPALPHLSDPSVRATPGRVGVMPSSRWPGKEIMSERWARILAEHGAREVIVFGLPSDARSVALVEDLRARGMSVTSALGQNPWRELAREIQGLERLYSVDTGLAHFAESLGVPVHVVFGPTHPDLGFGPWRKESRVEMTAVACRPCGKDGRHCWRMTARYACLREEGR